MSDTKLNPIPRPAAPAATPSLEEWIGSDEHAPDPAAKPVTIKAAVPPEFRRQLRVAAAAQDMTVADVLRELAASWLKAQTR